MYALPTISQASVTSALRCFRRDLRANGHELKTILTDNGSEFLHEDTLEALLHVPIYYCHPYSAWEKGSIERHNRLLRLYCPKSTNFSKLSPRTLKQTHRLIVHYPHSPKRPPNSCVCSKSSQTHCANLLTFYNKFGAVVVVQGVDAEGEAGEHSSGCIRSCKDSSNPCPR